MLTNVTGINGTNIPVHLIFLLTVANIFLAHKLRLQILFS